MRLSVSGETKRSETVEAIEGRENNAFYEKLLFLSSNGLGALGDGRFGSSNDFFC